MSFNEEVKQVLSDLQQFCEVTLGQEQLSLSARQRRDDLMQQVRALKDEYPGLKTDEDWGKRISSISQTGDVYEDPEALVGLNKSGDGSTGEEQETYDDIENLPRKKSTQASPPTKQASTEICLVAATELECTSVVRGYLHKKRDKGFVKGYQKKWCVVSNGNFYIYDKPTDKKQGAAFSLQDCTAEEKSQGQRKDCYPFEVSGAQGKKSYQFYASSKDEVTKWMEALNEEDLYEPFDELQSQRELIRPKVSLPRQTTVDADEDDDEENDDYEDDLYDAASQVQEEIYDEAISSVPAPAVKADSENGSGGESSPPPLPTARIRGSSSSSRKEQPPTPTDTQINGPNNDIDYKNLFYGKWDCMASESNELEFKQGDIVLVTSKVHGQWWMAENKGKKGLVPANYMTPVYGAA